MSKQKNSKIQNLILLIIILLILSGIIYVFLDDSDINSKNINNDINYINQDEEQIEETETFESTSERKVVVFIDKDMDKVKDDNETACDVCIGKYLVAANIKQDNKLPGIEGLKEINIQVEGVVDEEKFVGFNTVWGFFSDREIIIPPTNIILGDSSQDLYIPAWDCDVEISGVNSNISFIDNNVETGETIYAFAQLVPAFIDAESSSKDIWLYFVPDVNEMGKIYITNGKLNKDIDGSATGVINSSYIKVNWNQDDYSDIFLEKKNISFILL